MFIERNASGSGEGQQDGRLVTIMARTQDRNQKESREKEIALKFFELVAGGRPKDARTLFAPDCQHHNPYLPAGMDALLESITKVQEAGPSGMPGDSQLDTKHVLAEGDLVAVHTTVQSRSDHSKGLRQIHLFRFSDDKIVEYWDVTQMVPEDSPYANRMF